MALQRKIDRVVTVPPAEPGFGGPHHKAAPVISSGDFARTDPFFILMDDRVSVDGPFGEAHPHAGLETVSLILSGSFSDGDDRLEEGDMEWMTSGSGIVHNENSVIRGGLRLLQLWLVLPDDRRNMPPRVQRARRDSAPVRREPGVELRLYSGRSGDVVSPTLNVVPVILADIRLKPGATFEQDVPASYNGFLFVLEGEVAAGEPSTVISAGQVGWLDRPPGNGASVLVIRSARPARVLLYAGQPQNISLAARGPFIAGSEAELKERFAAFRRGTFPRASSLRWASTG